MVQRSTLDLWTGVFVAIGIGALVFLSLKVANVTAELHGDSYTVSAEFSNLGGLKPQAPVKSAGVVVGRVTGIALDTNTFKAKVTLAIEKQYQFPKDSIASIFTAGLLGDQYIDISVGGDVDTFAEGDTIHDTNSAVVLETLIGQFLFNKAAEGEKK